MIVQEAAVATNVDAIKDRTLKYKETSSSNSRGLRALQTCSRATGCFTTTRIE